MTGGEANLLVAASLLSVLMGVLIWLQSVKACCSKAGSCCESDAREWKALEDHHLPREMNGCESQLSIASTVKASPTATFAEVVSVPSSPPAPSFEASCVEANAATVVATEVIVVEDLVRSRIDRVRRNTLVLDVSASVALHEAGSGGQGALHIDAAQVCRIADADDITQVEALPLQQIVVAQPARLSHDDDDDDDDDMAI